MRHSSVQKAGCRKMVVRRRTDVAIRIVMLLVLSVLTSPLFAQAPKPPSLKEQLEAQYPPTAVLVVQKEGILAVAPSSNKLCVSKFMHGVPKIPDPSCAAALNNGTRALTVGERVHPSELKVDVSQEKIWFWIVECDSCNAGIVSSSYKAQIELQFGSTRFLEKGNVTGIEDEIGKVLTIDDSPPPVSPAQPAAASGEALTNGDVVKMVKAKLGDDIIISTVNSSACNFDTSVNGMVTLKEAGVSDPVIKAMRDAQAAANAASNDTGPETPTPSETQQPNGAPSVPGQVSFYVHHLHFGSNCSGTLSVSPDGTVAYDCDQADPKGRCDHVSFAPGSLTEAKKHMGGVHLASKTQGKWDFYGHRNDIDQALAKIAPLVQK
jgi:hypothetical protein